MTNPCSGHLSQEPVLRRSFLSAVGGSLLVGTLPARSAPPQKRTRLGIGASSFGSRRRAVVALRSPLGFIRYCQRRGAGGVQLPLGAMETAKTATVREFVESNGMFIEASIGTPRRPADVDRFEAEVRTAKKCAGVIRCVMLSGRRYETFKSRQAFLDFKDRSVQRLKWAEPVVRRQKMRLAIENHKDFRTDELIDFVRQAKSDWVGVCVDTGNNLALLDLAEETAEQLAPWAFSCHLKDMGVESIPEGFLLSEVPLGQGVLDLPRIVRVLLAKRPELQFSLEMITRDPLRIPCLTESYWKTMPNVRGIELARMLRFVGKNKSPRPLPRVGHLPVAERLKAEEINVVKSMDFAARLFAKTDREK